MQYGLAVALRFTFLQDVAAPQKFTKHPAFCAGAQLKAASISVPAPCALLMVAFVAPLSATVNVRPSFAPVETT
jgi:hypothetical protein